MNARRVLAPTGRRALAMRAPLLAASLVLALAGLMSGGASAAALFGLVNTGELFRSADGGASWTPHAALPVRDAVALSARLLSSDLFLATRSGGIYRSLDGGATWAAVGGIAASDLTDLAIRPDGVLMALATSGAVHVSTDLGASFAVPGAVVAPNCVSLTLTSSPPRAYVLTRTGEVYEGPQGGTSWTAKSAIPVPDARRIRSIGAEMYVLTESGDVHRSVDGGATWLGVGTLSQVGMRGLVRNGPSLVAATREGHVAASVNGENWTWQGSINQLELTALASDEPATTSVLSVGARVLRAGEVFPNPSPDRVAFRLELDRDDEVRVALYDVAGRRVATTAPRHLGAGSHAYAWRPGVARGGLYFVRIETASGLTATRRWVALR